MREWNYKKIAKVAIPILIALLSVFVVSKYAASPEFHKKTIASLDEKKKTVMELTAASTAASVTISLLPDDMGTPLAEKLMDLSGYFLIVLSALYLEKYLLTITGFATFSILIPIACVLLSVSVFWNGAVLRALAKKLTLFGLAIALVIPTSMKISDLIENTYETSLEQTIEEAKETTEEIEKNTEGKESVWKDFLSKIKGGFSGIVKKMETSLNNFIEALAVMIVTSCLIPILVMVFFLWIIKGMLGIDLTGAIPKAQNRLLERKNL